MITKSTIGAALLVAASLPFTANAATATFNFAGGGVSGHLVLTYGSATDSKYPQAFEVTGISGTFSDSNNSLNIVNAPVGPLVPINFAIPEPTNLLAPHDFSRFAVATGLSPENHGFLTYDNLYWPGGSPQTASDYPFHGGVFDIYGLMFEIGGGRVVDVWSNGDSTGGTSMPIYGAAVATHDVALDYTTITPEPNALVLLSGGVLVIGFVRRRRII